MTQGPDFRRAASSDVETLIGMMRGLWAHDSVPFNEPAARKGLDAVFDSASQPGPSRGEAARIWILEWHQQPAGYMVLTFAFSLEFGGWHAFIDELYVRDGYRSRGWGSQALDLAVETCRALGLPALLLEADLENPRATALYERRGFREHHRRLMRLNVAE